MTAITKKERARLENASRPRSGRPRKIDKQTRDYLVDIAFHESPRIQWRSLTRIAAEEIGEDVHKRSVQRLFAQMNMRKWKCLRRPALLPEHADKRLAWAQLYNPTDYPSARWKIVKWSDECYVERGVGVRDEWVFCRSSERLDPANVQERPTPHGIKQMFWASFGYECQTDLVAMEGDPLSERLGVTSQVYLEVLKEHLPMILNPGDIFMQDGAGIHRARIVKQWFREEGIELMDWPPYSPDLNPIKNLWAMLKEAIHKKYPELEFATKTDENLDLLIRAAQECWAEMGDTLLYRLSDTMPRRVQAVLDAEGWYTKY